MRVKVCGITNFEDALFCVKCGADALGFIFYDKSPRSVESAVVFEIIKKLPPFVNTVGVFVNEEIEKVNRLSKELNLSYVQIHGDESPEYINQLITPSIKAFRISANFDFDSIYKFNSNFYLLDAFSPSDYGGTGNTFNWETIPKDILSKTILAGGISAENCENIYRNVKPAAIDISSKLEMSPGIKNHEKVINFFNVIKKLEYKC